MSGGRCFTPSVPPFPSQLTKQKVQVSQERASSSRDGVRGEPPAGPSASSGSADQLPREQSGDVDTGEKRKDSETTKKEAK